MTYFRMGNPHYHRRGVVSLSCSGWEGVGPTRYGRQTNCCQGSGIRDQESVPSLNTCLTHPEEVRFMGFDCNAIGFGSGFILVPFTLHLVSLLNVIGSSLTSN
jgi:hypothetical protein